ncbi:hypothetical protein HDU96_005554 [Phlyctochytrium bullatum]|nr:hypothetical protein HDU96_005554 [Phlyctochytrium bullatum]
MSSEPVEVIAAPEVEDNTFKVFAGNLAFSITEDDLKEAFGKAGPVISANIIVRNNRSLGYGFVSFATEAEAKKAVELLDKVELAGRPLNVEVAKPKVPGEQKPAPRARRGRKGATTPAPAEGGAEGEAAAPAPARRRRGKQQEARIDQDGEEGAEGAEGGAPARKPRSRRRKGKKARAASAGAAGAESATEGAADGAVSDGAVAPRRGRRQRREKSAPPADAPLSKTMLFVANLPFKVDNEALASIFKDYKVTSAKVVTLRNGRSKGFGFVEVENEEEQARVMSELQNVSVDGRDLIIKVALQSSHSQMNGETEAAAEAAPAAQ